MSGSDVCAGACRSSQRAWLDKVQLIEVDGPELTCTSLFGEIEKVQGAIKRVDLANSTVLIALE